MAAPPFAIFEGWEAQALASDRHDVFPVKLTCGSFVAVKNADVEGHIWQRRFYDFVVNTEHKRVQKLRYMHRNPVGRGLVLAPDQWRWSSYRDYAHGQCGPVLVNEQRPAELKVRVAG